MRLLFMIAKGCEDTLILVIDRTKNLFSFLSLKKISFHIPLKSFLSHLKKKISKIFSSFKKIISFFHPLNLIKLFENLHNLILSIHKIFKHIKKLCIHPVPITIFSILSVLSVLIIRESIDLKNKFSSGNGELTLFQKTKYATVVSYRPIYYKRYEKQFRLRHLAIPIHIKGKKKLKRIFMDFTVETSSRSLKEYLSKRTHLIQNRFNTLIEPIIPELPMEKEGKTIIVQKLKREINHLVKDLKIRGRIEKIHVHSILII